MKLDGKAIAEQLYGDLQKRIKTLQKKHITPHLVVFLVGENPASVAYVILKQKKGEEIGAKVTVLRYKTIITTEELAEKVKLLNQDPYVHGILIQRPLPEHIDEKKLELLTDPEKDIDGFHPDSTYTLPLPLAAMKILEHIYSSSEGVLATESRSSRFANTHSNNNSDGVAGAGTPFERPQTKARTSERGKARQGPDFNKWLNAKHIVLLGKGPTGGGPILEHFKTFNVTPHLIDSKTKDPEKMLKQADIIISAVGRKNVIKPESLKKDVILISVGINRGGEQNKLHGDYDEAAIQDIAAYYTPTPGGVGPVNVAMLMDNLITAAEKQTQA